MRVNTERVAYAAAAWASIFAILHVVWASGWYIGLDQKSAREAFRHRWVLVYDLVVAALCMLAAVVAVALIRRMEGRLLSRWIVALAWTGTSILALRGGIGVTQASYLTATGHPVKAALAFWDVWFCLGALLFGLSVWRYGRLSR